MAVPRLCLAPAPWPCLGWDPGQSCADTAATVGLAGPPRGLLAAALSLATAVRGPMKSLPALRETHPFPGVCRVLGAPEDAPQAAPCIVCSGWCQVLCPEPFSYGSPHTSPPEMSSFYSDRSNWTDPACRVKVTGSPQVPQGGLGNLTCPSCSASRRGQHTARRCLPGSPLPPLPGPFSPQKDVWLPRPRVG